MISQKSLGAAVQEFRKAAGLTQQELAQRSETAKQAISNIERGASLPTLRTLEQLSSALHVLPSEILRRAEGKKGRSSEKGDTSQLNVWTSLEPDVRELALEIAKAIVNSSVRRKGK